MSFVWENSNILFKSKRILIYSKLIINQPRQIINNNFDQSSVEFKVQIKKKKQEKVTSRNYTT